jgi:signal transduction histidine kinase
VLTTITYLETRSSLVDQELKSVGNTALANALIIQGQAHNFSGNVNQVNESVIEALSAIDLASSPPTLSMLYLNGRYITDQTSSVLSKGDLPTSLIASTKRPAAVVPYQQVFTLHGQTVIGTGIPIPEVGAVYYEIFHPDETLQTLRILLATLGFASLAAIVLAGILGRWAATRVLRPLREISQAALDIAGGQLATRIETHEESDLATLAASFNRMVDRLQERIEREARFTSDVAHELRSPLTTLAASLSVLEARREGLPARSLQALELLSSEVRRFERMVRDLLEISRFDSGTAEFEPSVVGVGELVRRALDNAGAQDVPLEIAPGFERRRLIVDKRRFERIIANLIENANRYAGGATRVLVEGGETQIRFVVEDDGPGIPAAERERIFQRFARATVAAGSRGSGDGTGLGLALVTEHVKLHNGKVWVEDSPSGGARFVIQLPLQSGVITAQDDDGTDGTDGTDGLVDEETIERERGQHLDGTNRTQPRLADQSVDGITSSS